jgi:hypothetical protein
MGVVTQYRFDPFGNKAVEIDGAGARSEWKAATADYAVGRIETYTQPAESGLRVCSYTYSDFGELKVHAAGNTNTQYSRHKNGLVAQILAIPDVTRPNVREITTYQYDAGGHVTSVGRIDSVSLQTIVISYDNQGRLWRVEDQNKSPAGPTCDVHYAYDEWSNVRRIQATYTQTAAEGAHATEGWYDYDAAGRMTVSNGALSGGAIRLKVRTSGSVQISYDTVGRRRGTTEYVRANTTAHPTIRTWDTMRDERYTYDDLGHLGQIEQRIRQVNIVDSSADGAGNPVTEPTMEGTWQTLSTRVANLRGDVTQAEQWARILGIPNVLSVSQTAARLGTTTTAFHPDGQVNWTKFNAVDPKNSTETQNTYNPLSGLLDSYTFKAFRSDGAPFTTTFDYDHTFQNGARVVRSIRDLANGLNTTKTYDLIGRLSSERVDLQKPNGTGSDRYEERFYQYGADGRAILKNTDLRLSASGPDTVPLPTPSTGQQTYVYAGNRMAATVGALRLSGATRFDFAYTPMSEASLGGATRYVVQTGDSLISIAQAAYGDGALSYLISDANSIVAEPGDALPSTEVGKAYEIPEVVRSSQGAGTFTPYGLADIVGNDRPIAIPAPPPPKHSDIEMLALAAVSITVEVGVTVGLSALGVPAPASAAIGAGLSDLAGQATSWELGMQVPGHEGIDWGGVGLATIEGGMFSMAGPASVLSREVWQQLKGGFEGWTSGSGPNWSGIAGSLFNVGFDALAPVLGGPRVGPFNFGVGRLINSAYNPSSGWAIPGSGRSPTVGAFEYAYGAVANGLASIGYYWIRNQLERPSAPSGRGRFFKIQLQAAQFEGSQEIVPSQTSTQTLVDLDKYEVGAHGGVISFTDASGITTIAEVIRVSGEAPPPPASVPEEASPLERFWMGAAIVQAQETAQEIAADAAASLVRDHGPELAELQRTIDYYQRDVNQGNWGSKSVVDAAKREQRRLVEAYSPPQVLPVSVPTNSPGMHGIPSLSSFMNPASVLTQAEVFAFPKPLAANILPERPQPFGDYGNPDFQEYSLRSSVEFAYAYEGEMTGYVEINDLDRIARQGPARIFVGSGIHRDRMGNEVPDPDFLENSETAAKAVMQRYPGKVEIDVLDLADPIKRRLFNEIRAAATTGTAYEIMPAGSFATLDSYCHGACAVLQGPPGEPTPTYFPTEPEFRTVVDVTKGRAVANYAIAGAQIASGELNIYAGFRQDNKALGALQVTGGAAQVAGGISWTYGMLRESDSAISFASKANTVGNYLTAPLTLYEVWRDTGAPGEFANRSKQESLAVAIIDVSKLAQIVYPEAVFTTLLFQHVFMPVAGMASDYLTPKFIGAMSQAYGMPEQWLWSMH